MDHVHLDTLAMEGFVYEPCQHQIFLHIANVNVTILGFVILRRHAFRICLALLAFVLRIMLGMELDVLDAFDQTQHSMVAHKIHVGMAEHAPQSVRLLFVAIAQPDLHFQLAFVDLLSAHRILVKMEAHASHLAR